MSMPPEAVLKIDETRYKHDFRTGLKNKHFWLVSNRFSTPEAMSCLDPPKEGFRLLGNGIVGRENSPYAFTEVLRSWPRFPCVNSLFVLPPKVNADPLKEIRNKLVPFFKFESSNSSDPESNETLWELVNLLHPIYYFHLGKEFTMISSAAESGIRIINSAEFKTAEERKYDEIRNQIHKFWKAVGPEVGPEECVVPNCKNLRIEVAIRCLEHQYIWCVGENKNSCSADEQ